MPETPQWVVDNFGPSLAQAGISLESPCDVGALADMISKDTQAFITETTEEIQKMTAEGAGPMFLALMFIILESVLNMTAGVAAAYANQMAGAIIGGQLGALYAAVALALTSIDGLQLIMAYLGALALRNSVIKHQRMSRIIDADVKILIVFIQNLIETFGRTDKRGNEYAGLRIAIEELKIAAKMLGIEYNKVDSGVGQISRANIESVQRRIERSMHTITGGTFSSLNQNFSDAISEAFPESASSILDFSAGDMS